MRHAKPLRIAALLRVSTAPQAEKGYSLEDQRRDAPLWCAQRHHTLVEMCEDAGVTGHIKNRPAVLRVMELIKTHSIDAVLMPCVDRIGREARIILNIVGEIRDAGAAVYYMDLDLPDDEAGRLLEGNLANIAEFAAADFRKRGMRGKRQKATTGRYPAGIRIWGYRVVKRWEEQAHPELARRSGELLEEPAEANEVRRVFAEADSGASLYSIGKRLTAEGVPTPRGGTWDQGAVRRVLGNRAYIGELWYGRLEHKLTYGRGRTHQHDETRPIRMQLSERPPEHWIQIPCPALVEREVWERVQTRLRLSAEIMAGRPSISYLLRGCIRCAKCVGKRGEPRVFHGYRVDSNPKHPGYENLRYRCKVCTISLDAHKIEAKALKRLREAADPEQAKAIARKLVEKKQAGAANVDGELKRLHAELLQLDADEERLADLALSGISAHIIRGRVAKLITQREAKQARLAVLEKQLGHAHDVSGAEARAEAWATELTRLLAEAESSPVQLQALFRRYVRITCQARGRTFMEIIGPLG